MAKEYKGGVTEAQIKEWSSKYGVPNVDFKVAEVKSLTDPSKKLAVYFKKPDKKEMALSLSHILGQQPNPVKAKEILCTNCVIWRDPGTLEPKTKSQYDVAIGTIIGEAFEIPDVELGEI